MFMYRKNCIVYQNIYKNVVTIMSYATKTIVPILGLRVTG